MKKISLLLTVIMTVSVLNGCNLSDSETKTKDIKNKEEISYSKNDDSNDKDKHKKETNTASETVKKFEEKSINLNENDKKMLSALIGEICNLGYILGRTSPESENILPTTDEDKLNILWLMFCDSWLYDELSTHNSKPSISEERLKKILKDAFGSENISLGNERGSIRYNNGYYEVNLGNRGDEGIVTDITKVTQFSEEQAIIEGTTKLVSGDNYYIGYLKNFKAIANINEDSMFGGYTLINLECWDASKEDNDYILSDSDKKYLSAEDVKNLSKDELAIARNEIFARHGYIFKMEEYKNYFEGKMWYKEDPSFSGSESELNEYEKANINLIKSYEK